MREKDCLPENTAPKGISQDKGIIILLLCLLAFSVWCIVSGILGLGKAEKPLDDIFAGTAVSGDRYGGEVEFATPCFLQIAHSMNLIPTGNEYYYLIFQGDDYSRAYVVRSKKKWGDLFGENGALSGAVTVSGSIKTMPQDAANRLDEVIREFADTEYGYPIEADRIYYLDLLSRRLYGMRILTGACLFYMVWMLYCICFKGSFSWKTPSGKLVQSTGCIVAAAALVCGIYLSVMK